VISIYVISDRLGINVDMYPCLGTNTLAIRNLSDDICNIQADGMGMSSQLSSPFQSFRYIMPSEALPSQHRSCPYPLAKLGGQDGNNGQHSLWPVKFLARVAVMSVMSSREVP
jgi:hypothetical protein